MKSSPLGRLIASVATFAAVAIAVVTAPAVAATEHDTPDLSGIWVTEWGGNRYEFVEAGNGVWDLYLRSAEDPSCQTYIDDLPDGTLAFSGAHSDSGRPLLSLGQEWPEDSACRFQHNVGGGASGAGTRWLEYDAEADEIWAGDEIQNPTGAVCPDGCQIIRRSEPSTTEPTEPESEPSAPEPTRPEPEPPVTEPTQPEPEPSTTVAPSAPEAGSGDAAGEAEALSINSDGVEGGSICGTVRNSDGQPIEGVRIDTLSDNTALATTDASGSYCVPGWPDPGRGVHAGSYQLRASDPSGTYEETFGGATVGEGEDVIVDFSLWRADQHGTVAGTVTDESGVAVEQARVNAASAGQYAGLAFTEADGSYSLRLPPGDYSLRASDFKGDFSPDPVDLAIQTGQTVTQDFVLAIVFSDDPGSVSGTVTDDSGAALAFIRVDLDQERDQIKSTQTAADGTYRLDDVQSGSYRVRVFGNDLYRGQGADVEVVEGENTTVDFVLVTSGRIHGWVRDTDGNPIEGVLVNADDGDGIGGQGRTGADGAYQIQVSPGTYTVYTFGDDVYAFHPGVPGVEVTAMEFTKVDLVLESTGALTGTVADETGDPLAGYEVRARGELQNRHGPGGFGITTTAADGTYRIDGLAPMAFDVEVSDTDGAVVAARGGSMNRIVGDRRDVGAAPRRRAPGRADVQLTSGGALPAVYVAAVHGPIVDPGEM